MSSTKTHDSQLYKTNRVLLRRMVERTGQPCAYCGLPIDLNAPKSAPLSFTVDHVVPVSAGGSDRMDNLVPAHYRCNIAKSDKIAIQQPKKASKATRRWW